MITIEIIKKYWRILFTTILCIFAVIGMKSCINPKVARQNATKTVALPKDDKEDITVSDNKVTITTSKGTKEITGARETKIEVKKDGEVVVTEKVYGFEHQFGFNGYISGQGAGLGLDFRGFYFKRFDAMSGLGYAPQTKRLDGWLGLGYTPANSWISNTTFFAGYTVAKHAIAGISLKF